ncbi:hypothetical protein ACIF80_18710 [Streptomyces sp. NPDC085927]|uniref:hypothetical protein n=1 Tax=Streptomyces sp. NPDC085927 TaxID=3365738 RepID=UPI0037D30F9B
MALRRKIVLSGVPPATAAGFMTALPAAASQPSPAAATGTKPAGDRPTVVLVHGAYADSSRGNGLIERLRHDGHPVRAAAHPLRGLPTDTATVTGLIEKADHSTR